MGARQSTFSRLPNSSVCQVCLKAIADRYRFGVITRPRTEPGDIYAKRCSCSCTSCTETIRAVHKRLLSDMWGDKKRAQPSHLAEKYFGCINPRHLLPGEDIRQYSRPYRPTRRSLRDVVAENRFPNATSNNVGGVAWNRGVTQQTAYCSSKSWERTVAALRLSSRESTNDSKNRVKIEAGIIVSPVLLGRIVKNSASHRCHALQFAG